jgi:hypothetical protein
MAKSNLIAVLSALLVLLLFVQFSTTTEARNVGVGVYLLNAVSLDTLNGFWQAEAMLYFYEDDNATYVPRIPYFANYGGAPSTVSLVPALRATNVFQKFIFRPNPREYPFDTQRLEISLEDFSGAPESEIQFYWLEEMSGVSPDLRLRGWSWDPNTKGEGTVKSRTYFGGQKVSQMTWMFAIRRAKVVAVQVLLPPFFVLVSVLISFIMPITASITRIGIVGSALISEVSLHSGFKSANGTAGTLGIIDYFFLLTYSILVISLGINVLVMILLRRNAQSPLAVYLESRAKYFVWFVCPGLYTFIFFRGKLVWAAVICLVTPLILLIIFEKLLPRMRAFRRKRKATQKKKHDDAIFGDEEIQAKLQDGEGIDGLGGLDTRTAAVQQEIAHSKGRRITHANEGTDSASSANLYDTDSE